MTGFGYIYCVTNTLTGKRYIGQTIRVQKRWAEHNRSAFKGSTGLLHKAIRKYGKEKFSFEILFGCNDKLHLDLAERFAIGLLTSVQPNGYNIASHPKDVRHFRRPSVVQKSKDGLSKKSPCEICGAFFYSPWNALTYTIAYFTTKERRSYTILSDMWQTVI